MTLTQCAFRSHMDSQEAFSYDFKTGECEVVIEDPKVLTICPLGSNKQHFKTKDSCSVPVLPGYALEHPYYDDSALARYTCSSFTDTPPVDSCPVVKCAGPLHYTNAPASCSVRDVFNSSAWSIDGYEYEGGVTCTVKGVVCQRWDTDFPHRVNYYRGRSDLGNNCKMAQSNRPWCYTTDPKVRWDYCPVEALDCGAPPIIPNPPSNAEIKIKWPYNGSKGQAWYQCESLAATDPVQHCPVARCEGDLKWSKANVSCSVNDCHIHNSYTGRVSCTLTGHTCQRWDSDEPHAHSAFRGRSDLENWCQIGGEDRPWCYTTSPRVIWDFCPVRECP
ncbi:plasminogen-like [Pecten maximus]|uniref:plasminogen-like n=1 Tax=Pecten maximus TaxID=6579 RepID=UPI001458F89C|nr:plasminogen-like [Pecten maximus]